MLLHLKISPQGTWVWSDGSSYSYTNWISGQPATQDTQVVIRGIILIITFIRIIIIIIIIIIILIRIIIIIITLIRIAL